MSPSLNVDQQFHRSFPSSQLNLLVAPDDTKAGVFLKVPITYTQQIGSCLNRVNT